MNEPTVTTGILEDPTTFADWLNSAVAGATDFDFARSERDALEVASDPVEANERAYTYANASHSSGMRFALAAEKLRQTLVILDGEAGLTAWSGSVMAPTRSNQFRWA